MYSDESRLERLKQKINNVELYESYCNAYKLYTVKCKRYLDSLQIKYYETPLDRSEFVRYDESEREEKSDEERQADSIAHSRSRTINAIYDYGKSNRWHWWCTFTFNPDKVDRYDFSACSKKMSNWLHVIRRKNSDLKYLIVPELHKDGAYHFHGLFSNTSGIEFVNSGHKYKSQVIYNISNFRWGFTHALETDGSMKLVSYLVKYISKDLVSMTKGKKRYWVSKNLELPEVLEYHTQEKFLEVLETYDVSEAYFKELEGFKTVSICEIPIYSTNVSCFAKEVKDENFLDSDTNIE